MKIILMIKLMSLRKKEDLDFYTILKKQKQKAEVLENILEIEILENILTEEILENILVAEILENILAVDNLKEEASVQAQDVSVNHRSIAKAASDKAAAAAALSTDIFQHGSPMSLDDFEAATAAEDAVSDCTALDGYAVDAGFAKGYLLKKGHSGWKSWQKRYFVLRNGILSYGDSENSAKRNAKAMDVANKHCRVHYDPGRQDTFQVQGLQNGKPTVMQLRVPGDMAARAVDIWVEVLDSYVTAAAMSATAQANQDGSK